MSVTKPSISKRMAKGAAWTVSMRLALSGLGMLSTIILARLLVPEDFGLVAIATALAAALDIFGEFSFDIWLIRKENANRTDYDTVWTLTLIRGTIIGAVLVVSAEVVANFYGDPRLELIIYLLAFATLVSGAENCGVIDFRKHLEFHREFVLIVSNRISSFLITIVLAFWLRSYWALIIGIVSQKSIRVLLSYFLHPYRPHLCLKSWGEAFHFSKWLLVSNILGFGYIRSDVFIIGKLTNASTLGFYNIAYEIANLTTTTLVAPMRRAILPGFSKLSGDRVVLQQSFIDVLALTLLLGIPFAVGIGLTASPAVNLLLGNKWVDAIPLIQILVIYSLASIVGSNIGPLLLALGLPRLRTTLLAIGCLLIFPALVFGVNQSGAVGAAWAVTSANILFVLIGMGMALRVLELPVSKVLNAIWRSIAAAVLMAIVVSEYQNTVISPQSFVEYGLIILVSVLIGAVVYVGTHLLLWRLCKYPVGAESQLLATLRDKFNKQFTTP